jgi:hypothetical protein
MKATTRRSLRRARYLAASWHVLAHIAFALGTGFSCGIIVQSYASMISPLDAAIGGTLVLYPLMVMVRWWVQWRGVNGR